MTRVAVIGLGRIGCGEGPQAGQTPRSHVGAVLAVPGLTLAAAIDPSTQARETARKLWNLPASVALLTDITELGKGAAEVIAVAGPTAARRQNVLAALEKKPKVLIVEKPLAASLADGAEIAERAKAEGVTLRVNFQRRLDTGHRAFRAAMAADPKLVICRYGKGLFNYASHMVDILVDWFGPVASVEAFSAEAASGDPNLTFRARMKRGFDVLFVGVDGLGYDQFEMEFYLPDQKLELACGGVEKRRSAAVPDRFYKGYVQLGPMQDVTPPQVVGGFQELYESVHEHLTRGAPLEGCGPEDALHGLAVLDAARASARTGGKSISIAGIPSANPKAAR